jgi:hypothetical protein
MRIAFEPIAPAAFEPEIVEIVPPRTNTAAILAAENFFAGLHLRAPFCLEMIATEHTRWFQLRTREPAARRLIAEHVQVAYPQAILRAPSGQSGDDDPAAMPPDVRVAACTMSLAEPQHLPLRTFDDLDVATEAGTQADPVLGILAALGTVPPGCRAISQLVLQPAPADWSRPYLRMAVEHPLAAEQALAAVRSSSAGSPSGRDGGAAIAVVLCLGAGFTAWRLGYLAAIDWHDLLRYGAAVLGAGGALAGVYRWTHRPCPIYDQEQVRQKISRPGFRMQLRLAVIGPASAEQIELDDCLDRVAAAYGVFALAFGNRLTRRRLKLSGRDLRRPEFIGRADRMPILNARELAGLWHLPRAQADVPLLERSGARRILPLPSAVASGCRIGQSTHQGRALPVHISAGALRRHLLVVAKTGRGKSALLARVALFVLGGLCASDKRAALILIDPHRDLAYLTLGCLPDSRHEEAIFLDAANDLRPFGLNLLDAGLGWDRDQMTMMVLHIFRREFSQAWGFRMESAFRYGLHTLFEANQTICRADPRAGRSRQYTILDLPPLLSDPKFRRRVLKDVTDKEVRNWWSDTFDRLNQVFQTEVIFPVQTKIFRFAGIQAARRIVGQPCSTIDPLSWVHEGRAVIVNTAAGIIGRDAAALIGDLLLNLVSLTIAQQAAVERDERARATLVVDEIHLMPGADFEALLSEQAKYGANVVLATQSLARLDALDREQERALRSTIFSNIDTLAVFNTSAEDAVYLEQELGEVVDHNDILALAEHECYLRLPNGRDGSPLVCSVQLEPPPPPDPAVQRSVADASAERYGRPAAAVDKALLDALIRIEQTHLPPGGSYEPTGAPRDEPGRDQAPPRPIVNGPSARRAAGAGSPAVQSGGAEAGVTSASASTPKAELSTPAPRRQPQRSQHRNERGSSRPAQASYLTAGGRIKRARPDGSAAAPSDASQPSDARPGRG